MILDKILPTQIPYPIRGAIIRGVRTFTAIVLGGITASVADGSLIAGISIIPPAYAPAVLLAVTTALVTVDKWLRERGLIEDLKDVPPEALVKVAPVEVVGPNTKVLGPETVVPAGVVTPEPPDSL